MELNEKSICRALADELENWGSSDYCLVYDLESEVATVQHNTIPIDDNEILLDSMCLYHMWDKDEFEDEEEAFEYLLEVLDFSEYYQEVEDFLRFQKQLDEFNKF